MPKMSDTKTFQTQDLALQVGTNVDRHKWNEDRYERFLDELCGDRYYQRQAILAALRYLLSGQYVNLRELALENWKKNPVLQERYGTWQNFERHLQMPDKLSATLDLATGTGKSYVIYGIAAILLAEGTVDRVLVLCPSTTIEIGLMNKFKSLSRNAELRDALPPDAKLRTPNVINASETITPGSICVENRDAVYEHVKSSIKDSLWGKGTRVAVLNDEAHHIANEPETKLKRWKEFLENPEYGFQIVLGFSGTCYVGNDYFSDVIYRFSLRQAMEERFVKLVRYIAEEPKTGEEDERWQLVYNSHERIRSQLQKKGIRPLTIIVTPTIKRCQEVGEELRDFLVERGKLSEEDAAKRVIVVYNNAPDVAKLRTLDERSSEVEWVVSVSMLNEGWDVKRVFQIVPHEERAFNSKLLIAQVLGRGLRVPEQWTGPQAEVTVFNHAAWVGSIRHLVNEILENERRLSSQVIPDSPYHFELHNLKYQMDTKEEEKKRTGPFAILKDDMVDLPSEAEIIDVSVDFERAVTETRETWKTSIQRKTYTPEEVAAAMLNRLEYYDMETATLSDPSQRTHYAKEYPYERLLNVVRKSLKGDTHCSEANRQRFLQAIGTIRRQGTKIVRYEFNPEQLQSLSTADRPMDSVSASQLRRDKVLFFTNTTADHLDEEQIEFFNEVKEEDSGFKRRYVENSLDFKTPVNLAIADSEPERKFMRGLVAPENAMVIDAWIKSTATGFYSIDYAWRKGEHPRRGSFNPDFFIKIGNIILVIEIKDSTELKDPSPENIKKNEYAVAHFRTLNALLEEREVPTRYQFHFLVEEDFLEFFPRLREGTIATYRSKLDVVLSELGSSTTA